MKSQIILTTVLGANGVLSRPDHADMSFDTWCVTYLSTYLVPVANPGRSTGASSLQRTFAGNSSVPVTQIVSQSVLTFDTSVVTSDASEVSSSVEVEPTEAQSGSETVSFDSKTGTLTDQITTSLGSTVSSDPLTTSTAQNEPPGRSVIFLISAPDTRKRQNTDRGFVGDNNPLICTFAESFNFAEEQLFENGVPFFYNGEDYKELAAGPVPPAGAVTRLFTTAGRSLQVDLPGGTAGFCQASDGTVYVTFTSGPAGCEAVSLEVYDERQCQNGRLVGTDVTTSAIETATSEVIRSESTSIVEGSAITETTALSSDSIAASSSITQTQSVGPVSQATDSEASTAASSNEAESTPIGSATSIAVSEVSTLPPVSSSVFDESTTAEVLPTSAPSLVSTSVQAEEPTSTSQASSDTIEPGTASSEESSSDAALETTTDASTSGIETTAVDETTTEIETTAEAATESETTTAETSVPSDETSTADVTSVESSTVAITSAESTSEASTTAEETTTLETTTAESTTAESTTEESTTQEPTTTAETTTDTPTTTTTTSAAATTTAALTCADLPNPYTDSDGNIYNLACNTDVDTAQIVDQITTDSFVDCMEACSGRSQCDGVEWESSNSQCTLINEIDGSGQSDGIDIAILQGF